MKKILFFIAVLVFYAGGCKNDDNKSPENSPEPEPYKETNNNKYYVHTVSKYDDFYSTYKIKDKYEQRSIIEYIDTTGKFNVGDSLIFVAFHKSYAKNKQSKQQVQKNTSNVKNKIDTLLIKNGAVTDTVFLFNGNEIKKPFHEK